ncbi:MAG: hypothetical protein WCL43_07025 [Chlorobium sp.]|jgi:hypothetical protein|nr:MAG: hypothetical protein FDX12_04555 [Chlorobium sp.]
MKWRYTIQTTLLAFILTVAFLGCAKKQSAVLDKDDIRFAGFYSDYLLISGVAENKDEVVLTAVSTSQLDKLLEHYTLTRESLKLKTLRYKQNPELWRAVLVTVRDNIRKKTTSGQ